MKSLSDRLLESNASFDKAFSMLSNCGKDIFDDYIKNHKSGDTIKDAMDAICFEVIDVFRAAKFTMGEGELTSKEIKEITQKYYEQITSEIEKSGFSINDSFDDYLAAMSLNESRLSNLRTADKMKNSKTSDKPFSLRSAEELKSHPSGNQNKKKFDLEDHPGLSALIVSGGLLGGGAFLLSTMYWLSKLCA